MVQVLAIFTGMDQPQWHKPIFEDGLKALGGSATPQISYEVHREYFNGDQRAVTTQAVQQLIDKYRPRVVVTADTPTAIAARDATRAATASEGERIPVVLPIVADPNNQLGPHRPLNDSHLIGIADHDMMTSTRERMCIFRDLLSANGVNFGDESVPIATVYNADNLGKDRERQNVQALAATFGMHVAYEVGVHQGPRTPAGPGGWDFETPISAIPRDIRGVVIIEEPTVFAYRHVIRNALQKFRLVEIWESAGAVSSGGAFCYGPDRAEAWAWAAKITHEIVEGNLRPAPGHDPPSLLSAPSGNKVQFRQLPSRLFYNPITVTNLGLRVPETVCTDLEIGIGPIRPIPIHEFPSLGEGTGERGTIRPTID